MHVVRYISSSTELKTVNQYVSVESLFEPLTFLRGPAMKSRFMLAPLTNRQSAPDGTATKEDVSWIESVARGGYGLVQTCAANVQASGKTFLGQLGIHSDAHLDGLSQMAKAIRRGGTLSAVQIHHGGHRARPELGGIPAPASDDANTGARAMGLGQIEGIRDAFIAAAKRAERAGFDGVAVHAAFGFALSEFLSPLLNRRTDRYGGSIENRSRLLFEVIDGIRRECKPDFQIGLRLSLERYGLRLEEIREVAAEALRRAQIDYLDLALWDSKQLVQEGKFDGRTMLSVFAELSRNGVRLGAAGKIMSGERAGQLLEEGCDFVLIGRAAILQADFPERVRSDPAHQSPPLPVTAEYLRNQGLSPAFLNYMQTAWDGFVSRDAA